MKYVGFGCSWMYGSELLDPTLPEDARLALEGHKQWAANKSYRETNCFLGKLGPNLNLSEPGNTIQGMFYKFCEWQKSYRDGDMCIMAFTESSRYSWYNNTEHDWEHTSWIRFEKDNPFYPVFKTHLAYSDCDELNHTIHYTSALSMISICKSRSIPYIAFNALPNKTVQIPDSNFMWDGHSMYDALHEQQQKGKRNYFHSGGHPNEEGHKWIASRVKDFIDTRYSNIV